MPNNNDKKSVEGKIDYIRLDRNECYYLINKKILHEIKQFDSSTLCIYPEFEPLKNLLANHCGVASKKIILTHGAEQAIRLTIQTLFKKGDRILLLSPLFAQFDLSLKSIGVKPKTVLYKEEENKFVFPTAKFLSLINKKTKGVLLCNPNNPLGYSIPKDEILSILKKAKQFNSLVVIDEAYCKFSGETSVAFTKMYKNLITIKSFSKEFGIAGLRIGYTIANEKIINRLDKKREMFWPISNFDIHAITILLKHTEYFDRQIKKIMKRKEVLISLLKKEKIKYYDTSANFFIIKSKDPIRLVENFRAQRILVSDISKYYDKKLLKNCVRITIPSASDMQKVKDVLSLEQ
jgi:histidinol-phosphate aminotransferase